MITAHWPAGLEAKSLSISFLVTLTGLVSEMRRLILTRFLFLFLTIADTNYRTFYSGAAHTTVFTVTTVFEPGTVNTLGALSVIEPNRLNIAPIVGGVAGGRYHAGLSMDIPINV